MIRGSPSRQLAGRGRITLILDIDGGPNAGRWHYDSAGLVRILSAKRTHTYSIPSPEALNSILGGE